MNPMLNEFDLLHCLCVGTAGFLSKTDCDITIEEILKLSPLMAVVRFLGWSNDLFDIQHHLPYVRLPLEAFLLLLLAAWLRGHLPHDRLLFLRPHLLRLLRWAPVALRLPLLHHTSGAGGGGDSAGPCSLERPVQVVQGHSVPVHGVLRGDPGDSRRHPPLGPSLDTRISHLWDRHGASLWCWGRVLCD